MMDSHEKSEVHLCPLLMRTVIFENGQCTENCQEECPIRETMEE